MFEHFHFLNPQWLWAAPPALVLLWLLRRSAAAANPWRRVVDAALLPHLMLAADGRPRRAPLSLVAVGWLVAVLALANPAWEQSPVPAFRGDQARVVVLDLSQSMLTPDLAPSRLERARFKVSDLIERSADGQTALVAYAGDAFVVAPLSDDYVTLASLLQALEPALMPIHGSRPDLGLAAAAELLTGAGAQRGEVILIADDAGDERALAVAGALREGGHPVSVLAVGTADGAPLPGVRGGVQRDAQGDVVVPRLDADALAKIAEAGGGRFALLAADDRDLDRLLTRRAPALDDSVHQAGVETTSWQGVGPWLALLLLPIGVLAFRRGWLLLLALAVMPPLLTPAPAMALTWDDLWQRGDQQAAAAAADGDHARAAELAREPARRGSARYRQGDYAAAAESFAAGSGAGDWYNRGNALALMGELEQAIEAYDQALAAAPEMADAGYNRDLVQQLLQQQQQQQSGEQSERQSGEQSDEELQQQDGQGDGQQAQTEGQSGRGGQQRSESAEGQQGNEAGDRAGQPPGQQADAAEASVGGEQQAGAQDGDQQGEAGESVSAQRGGAAADRQTAHEGGSEARSGADQNAQNGANEPLPGGPQHGQPRLPAEQRDRHAAGEDALAGLSADGTDAEEQRPGAPAGDDGDNRPSDQSQEQSADQQPLDPAAEERRVAMESWLRRIPDDAGGLLRRKFLYQYRQRGAGQQLGGAYPW